MFRSIKSKWVRTVGAFVLGIFFLFQPMVVYFANYDPGDCDDKAVHYFSAAYFTASREDRLKLESLLQPIQEKFQSSQSWGRTDFRLHGSNTYPFANLFIAFGNQVLPDFNDSVKVGLAAVTAVTLLLAVLLSSKTPFGFWQSVLVINLVAFYSIKLNFIVSQIPRNMHPFITYVPRGGGALLILPIVLAFAAKKPFLLLISILLIFLIHTGLGTQVLALFLLSSIIFMIFEKFKLQEIPLFYSLLLLTIFGGLPTFIASVTLGLILYFYSTKFRTKSSEFYDRVFMFAIITLTIAVISTGLITTQFVSKSISNYLEPSIMQELSQRFSGLKYVLVVLLTVVSLRIAYNFFVSEKYIMIGTKTKRLPVTYLIIAVLIFLALNHLSEYQWLAKRSTGFFYKTCQIAPLQLPQESIKLSINNESQFFISLGKYLFSISKKP